HWISFALANVAAPSWRRLLIGRVDRSPSTAPLSSCAGPSVQGRTSVRSLRADPNSRQAPCSVPAAVDARVGGLRADAVRGVRVRGARRTAMRTDLYGRSLQPGPVR